MAAETTARALVQEHLVAHPLPLRLWLAPEAWARLAGPVRQAAGAEAEVRPVPAPAGERLQGPAIVVATAGDAAGPARAELLRLLVVAGPARPLICGGARSRDALLDAINTWRVSSVLPDAPVPAKLARAVERAYRACAVEHAAARCAEELQRDCARLAETLGELEATRDRLIHAERVSTVVGFSAALGSRLAPLLADLEALQTALASLPHEPRRAELLAFAIEGVRGVETLLADLLAVSAGRSGQPSLSRVSVAALIDQAVRVLGFDAGLDARVVEVGAVDDVAVLVDRSRALRVLVAALRHALDRREIGQPVSVRARAVAGGARLVVSHRL